MQVDFFQVLRRVQKEERNKSSLARVDNDFYKQLRDYIKDLERSVASDPFGNEQLLLNNAQRIATEICELRESKITKAANNNIYRSFLLFKKDNPQFDLLDTTPLNLTDEEETLYFSLMDALKNHRYRISLDEYAEESTIEDEYEDEYAEEVVVDEDEDETAFVEDSFESGTSIESESDIPDDLEEEISNTLGESDEVIDKLNQIKDAKVVTDERYENIDRQVANQRHSNQNAPVVGEGGVSVESSVPNDVSVVGEGGVSVESSVLEDASVGSDDGVIAPQEPKDEAAGETSKGASFDSNDINGIYKNPDSQFVDLDKLEVDYNDDYYNAISAGSNYAQPTEDDFNMIFAKPKKPKSDEIKLGENKQSAEIGGAPSGESQSIESDKIGGAPSGESQSIESAEIGEVHSGKHQSIQADLGFSSGLDVKEGKSSSAEGFNKVDEEKAETPKVVDKTRGGVFTKAEIENATVVINENIGEMVGIDGKVYGPFLENDVVILPNITAQILISNNKASLVKL